MNEIVLGLFLVGVSLVVLAFGYALAPLFVAMAPIVAGLPMWAQLGLMGIALITAAFSISKIANDQ